MARTKVLQKLVYKAGAIMMRRELWPILKHPLDGLKLCDVELKETGILERNGERQEYQDVRLYLKDPHPPAAPSGEKE